MSDGKISVTINVCAAGISGKEISVKKKVIYAVLAVLIAACGLTFAVKQYGSGESYGYVEEKGQGSEAGEEEIADSKNIRTSVEGGQPGADGCEDQKLGVFVCGQVKEEGIRYLIRGARVDDAIRLAGGFTDEADRTYWNLAAYVYDGQRIYVPKVGEIVPYPEESNAYDAFGRLDLNAATVSMLTELPNIGEKRASDIVKFREKIGRFTSVDQLEEIRGIKGSVYQSIKDLVCVR